ncbi:hypothetical protein KP509_13G073700 [Ceratopteris richardii]|uniref:guanylate kinase n=1 Tax=Ceratopteris richardii TaxID=49495 RepID=A0A8T2TK36_CERRI|nr:hypothetical protein KP509_13G073700 [Ceratopteris richardii]
MCGNDVEQLVQHSYKMPGIRICSTWKASLRHYHGPSFAHALSAFSSLPSSRISVRNYYAFSEQISIRKCSHGQVFAACAFSSAVKHVSAFYSDKLPVSKEHNTSVGIMEIGDKESLLKEVEGALGSPLQRSSQAPVPKPLVMVISGPSGVGKDAVINRLKEVRDEIQFVVTATTRAKRPGEIDGKDYFFVTKDEFELMIQKGELLEHAIVYGDFKGIPKKQVRDCLSKGYDVVLRVDVQGAATIRSILGSGAVFIFLVAESEAALVKRLIERKTETKDKLLTRIATARQELKRIGEFDYVVVNADGQLEKTVSLITQIIDVEKARVHQREAKL